MNANDANELADALENDWADKFRFDAAIMLRQLQTENEELKAKIEGLDMVIWKLQTTITNRELRTYDGKLE